MLGPSEYLKSTDPDVREEIEVAFDDFVDRFVPTEPDSPYQRTEVFYEHGQWWGRSYDDSLYADEPERTFSVVDCSVSDVYPDGLDFEVT